MYTGRLKNIIKLQFKFAVSSVVATLVDYFLYLFLVDDFMLPVYANLTSASVGMIINFLLQKRYIFQLQRKVEVAFLISVAISLLGIALSTGFIYLLNKIDFFNQYQYITKALVIGIIFNYNFFFKRFAFEKRFIPDLSDNTKLRS